MSRFILANRYFHPDESATSQFATDLARHLAATHEVVVLASRQRLEDPQASLAAEGRLDGVRIVRLWSTHFGRGWLPGRLLDYLTFLASLGLWLVLHVRRGDTVLAKTDPPLLGVLTALATLGRGVRRIQWLQDLYPETAERLGVVREGGLVAALVRALRNWSLRRSDLVVTVSAGMLDYLRASAGKAQVLHIPNWADDYLAPDPGPLPAPRGEGTLTVGYSGNLGRAHPIEGLLELAATATDPRLRFAFTGGGAHQQRLRERVEALGRPNWSFGRYEPRERLAGLLRRPDLHLVILDPRVERFIFPSKVYGILSAGRPILHLGDPGGEIAALIRRHGCGWSLPARSGTPILALLRELLGDPARMREAGQNARAAYEAAFSRPKALEQWDAALRTL